MQRSCKFKVIERKSSTVRQATPRTHDHANTTQLNSDRRRALWHPAIIRWEVKPSKWPKKKKKILHSWITGGEGLSNSQLKCLRDHNQAARLTDAQPGWVKLKATSDSVYPPGNKQSSSAAARLFSWLTPPASGDRSACHVNHHSLWWCQQPNTAAAAVLSMLLAVLRKHGCTTHPGEQRNTGKQASQSSLTQGFKHN